MSQPPNRGARRHPETVTTAAQPDLSKIHVFSGTGAEIHIGDRTFHTAALTGNGVSLFQDYLSSGGIPAYQTSDEDSPGEIIVNGCLFSKNHAELTKFLAWCIEEDVPEDLSQTANPGDLVTCIDQFFDQSGIRWLERVIKNLASRASIMIDNQMGRLADQLLEKEMQKLNEQSENLLNASTTLAGVESASRS